MSSIFFRKIVQPVEQWFPKPKVKGSNPFFPEFIFFLNLYLITFKQSETTKIVLKLFLQIKDKQTNNSTHDTR